MNLFLLLSVISCVVPPSISAAIDKSNRCLREEKHAVCLTPGCIHAASDILKNLDLSVDPCDDFYDFACGGFIKRTNIPDDKSRVTSFNIIGDIVEEQLKSVLEEPPRPEEPKPFLLLKKFYDVCLNTAAIEEDKLATPLALLKKLGGWPVLDGASWNEDEFNWTNTMYKFRKIGLATRSLIYIYVGADSKNSSRNMVDIDQGVLGLNREYLVEGFDNEMVKEYYDYLVDVAVIFGADRNVAKEQLKESVEFEINLAKITLSKEQRRDMTTLYNPMTITQLTEKFPIIPWLELINNIIDIPGITVTEHEVVDVGVPQFIIDLEKLLQDTPKRVQANYVMSHVIKNIVLYLNQELRTRQLQYESLTAGTTAMKSRWKECIKTASVGMKIATAALYVRKYFNEDAKKTAKTLVSDVQATFIDLLKQIDWMDETTRKHALEKADAMISHIAYPQELLDDNKVKEYYSEFDVSDNYLESILKILKFMEDESFSQLRQVINKTIWIEHSLATNVDAYYHNGENSIQLPAGILQSIFFDNAKPQYMNYGSMGFVIGHEITHGFDDTGRQFNKDGELSEWWAEDTKHLFMKKAQCIIDQYNNYTIPELNVNLNGVNTQGENIADNGGIKEAYLAYEAWVHRNGEEPRLPGLDFTPKQLFWISSANLWCSKERKEYLKQHVLTDPHSPFYYRVIGSFSNSEHFARDFNCPVGSRMNPKNKCQVW